MKTIRSRGFILLYIFLSQTSSFCFAATTTQTNVLQNICCDHATKKTLCCLSKQILRDINQLENQLSTCCSTIESEIANLHPCGRKIALGQSDIPAVIGNSTYVCLKEDVLFNGSAVQNPGAEGPIGIAVSGQNVVIDLNNHTLFYRGASTNGIATIGKSAHVTIKNGTIMGTGAEFTAGILILTSNVTVKNVRIVNASGPGSAGILIQGAFLPAVSSPNLILAPLDDIVVEKCDLEGNFFGIELNTFSNSVLIKDCTINNSVQMGITQPSRKNLAVNITVDGCTISNSGLNGIYTTFSQANWTICNCDISNTGLNGLLLAGFQNLKIHNCQVIQSGAHGIIASIRQSQNVEISDCKVFNAQDSAIRVDNTANLSISNCQITNYLQTTAPLLKLQDIFNGLVTGCILTSGAGTSDGLLLRNCHGLTIQNCNANIFCNQPQTSCPVGFNLQGDVTSTVIKSCIISGNPSIGISLQQGVLNGPNTGVILENCEVQGAANQGILFDQSTPLPSTSCAIYNCKIIGNPQAVGADGIRLGSTTSECSLRDNTLTGNTGFGINNLAGVASTNRIYHNFAQGNGTGYSGVNFVVTPAGTGANVGTINNVDN